MALYLNPLMGNMHRDMDPADYNRDVTFYCPEHGSRHIEYSTDVDNGEKHYFCGARIGGDFEDGQHCDRPLPGPCDCGKCVGACMAPSA